jgi:hypothetical protein
MMTAGDHVKLAMSRLPGLQELEAKTLFSNALRYLYSKYKWTFLLVQDNLSTIVDNRHVSLPITLDWGRDHFWWDPYNDTELPLIDRYAMMGLWARVQGQTGQPEAISRGSLAQAAETDVPAAQMMFGPKVPDAIYTYPFVAFRKATAPTVDAAYPLWVEEFEDLITRRMEIEYARNPRHRIALQPRHEQEFYDRLWECFKRNDGGAEILRIKQTWRGGGSPRPFSNVTIYPATGGGSSEWGS